MLRVIVAFGRERHEWRRFRAQGEEAVAARVDLTVRQTMFSLVVTMTTAIGSALVLGFGAYHVLQQRPHRRRAARGDGLHRVALHSRWSRSAPPSAACSSSSSPCAARSTCSTPSRRSTSGRTRWRSTAPRGHVAFERVASATPAAAARSTTSRSTLAPGHAGRDRRPDRRRQEHAAEPAPALLRPRSAAACCSTATTCATSRSRRCARRSASCCRSRCCSPARSPTTSATGGSRPSDERGRRRPRSAANAHDFISALPHGYDTMLGERGAQLSGGERQRISVARAFLKDAPILILDEPTSSIDSQTEAVILDALERLMEGRTTFMVAHRLSTIRDADLILVVDHGPRRRAGHARRAARAAAASTRSCTSAQNGARRGRASAAVSADGLSELTTADRREPPRRRRHRRARRWPRWRAR